MVSAPSLGVGGRLETASRKPPGAAGVGAGTLLRAEVGGWWVGPGRPQQQCGVRH